MSGRNMEEYDVQRPVRRTRRKKTPWQKFKEAYLPLVIVLLGIILIITLIVGIVKLAAGGSGGETTIPKQTLEDTTAPPDEDVSALLTQAGELASHFDYDGAIALLQTSSDSRAVALANQYTQEKDSLVVWKDNTDVPHISFQQLVVDTGRAFDGDSASGDYKDYNLTVDEFRAILDQLYANGYVLISSTDIAAANGEGKYAATEIRLPSDRQPLMMSLIPAHYSLDMAGDGFPRRLLVGDDGKITCEYIDASATRLQGEYDFVSILESFIAQHPDFSYHGARAVLGLNGKSDPLGYSLSDETQAQSFRDVVQCLKDTGYEFASFTYGGVRYGDVADQDVESDVAKWEQTYEPFLGDTTILIYAGGSDLLEYSGVKYQALHDAGFRFFVGMDNDVTSWGKITDDYVRQDRRTINGIRITEDQDLVDDLFNANQILDKAR